MSKGFDAGWLALRQPFDHAARAAVLVAPFAESLRTDAPLRLVDLASGTGSNFRYLAPRLAATVRRDQAWRLIDHDETLLDRALDEIRAWAYESGWRTESRANGLTVLTGGPSWSVACYAGDLAADIGRLSLAPGEGVVASALLDLVSPAWLEALVGAVTAAQAPLLATLTYDGDMTWMPEDRDDSRVRALFNDHQRQSKGFGPALGPSAPAWLAGRLAATGYRVEQRRSPWVVDTMDQAMLLALVEGIGRAAAAQDRTARDVVDAWSLRRRVQIEAGLLSARIGHVDILGRP